jgi:hypothetical protein
MTISVGVLPSTQKGRDWFHLVDRKATEAGVSRRGELRYIHAGILGPDSPALS